MNQRNLRIEENRNILQSFYYGTCAGNSKYLSKEFKSDMEFKCPSCKAVFINNIEFMKHVSSHAQINGSMTTARFRCQFCYESFDEKERLLAHLENAHMKTSAQFVCRICTKDFSSKDDLLFHMRRFHVGAEAPYLCETCGFRSFSHTKIVEHFYKVHDRTDKMVCVLCLKIFAMFGETAYNPHAPIQFLHHIEKHYEKKFPCPQCNLRFFDEYSFTIHRGKDHVSLVRHKNFQFFTYGENEHPFILANPELGTLNVTKKAREIKNHPQFAYVLKVLDDLKVFGVSNDLCLECGKNLSTVGHTMAHLACTRCRYRTCCSESITMHVQLFHGKYKDKQYEVAPPIILEKDLVCRCGYKSKIGNSYATHLALCEKRVSSREQIEQIHSTKGSHETDPSNSLAEDSCVPQGPTSDFATKEPLGLQSTSLSENSNEN